MITGFNTDIVFQGTTYHVQTEDKGVKTPLILSLVYDRGTILASKRSAYNDLLIGDFDEKILAARLQKQHNLICAAIRTGRIEDLKRMAAKESASKQTPMLLEKEVKPLIEGNFPGRNVETVEGGNRAQEVYQEKVQSFDRTEAEKKPAESVENFSVGDNDFFSKPDDELIWDVAVSVVEEPIIEAVKIVEEELILSAEAVEIIRDEPILDTRLKIKLLDDEKFKSGDRKTIRILVNRGNAARGLSGAQVSIKILGSSFRSLIFHAKTDDNGIATIGLQLPQFRSGRAALLIKAMSEGEEIDLRRAITHD